MQFYVSLVMLMQLLELKNFSNDVKGLREYIKDGLEKNLDTTLVEILEINAVGPATGAALRFNFIVMMVLALILMLAYIAFRF